MDNISSERKKYLHGKRKAKFLTILAQVSFLAIFVAVWEILARFEVIDSFITSSPSRMFKTFADMLKNVEGLVVEEQWITTDVRPGRGEERWLNLILRKI